MQYFFVDHEVADNDDNDGDSSSSSSSSDSSKFKNGDFEGPDEEESD